MDIHESPIVTKDGHTPCLLSLHQFLVYSTLVELIEGLPTRRLNEGIIAGLVEKESQLAGHPAYLISPSVRSLEGFDYPFGIPEALPHVACIGRFKSKGHNEPMDISLLTIIWFQDTFAFPIDEKVVASITDLDWRRHSLVREL